MTMFQSAYLLAVWVGIALLFFIGGIFALDGMKYYRLNRNKVQTKGVVVAKEPDNHLFVRYTFEVNHRQHAGIGNVGLGNPSFEELSVGDSIRVYYDPMNPDNSLLTNPERHMNSITFGILFLTVVGSTFCFFGLYAKGWLPGTGKRH